MRPSPYAPHRAFVAPAFKRTGLLLLIFGFGVIELIYHITYDLIDALLLRANPEALNAFYLGATPLSLGAQLLSFAGLGAAVMLITRVLQKRPALTLIGPPGLAARQFAAVFLPLLFLLFVLELIPPWWSGDALERTRNVTLWAVLLPPALLMVFVQIGAEELLYRGYLQQQLATVFEHPASWLILTNVAFGLAHWEAGAGGAASLQYVLWAFAFGVLASDLTARSGTLGPALAFHLANNAFAFLLYGEADGPSSGFALFLFPPEALDEAFETSATALFSPQIFLEIGILLLMWLTARIALRR